MTEVKPIAEVARDLGFESEEEMHRLIASVDLSSQSQFAAFLAWRDTDGTKAGLLKLLPEAR